MRREKISEAIGNIHSRHIEEAEQVERVEATRRFKPRALLKYLALAAGICLLVVGVGGFAAFKIAHPWDFKVEELEGKWGESESLMSTAVLPHWEERPIYHQYNSMEWSGVQFESTDGEVPAERIGAFLGESVAWGQDYYAPDGEDMRQIGVKVYEVTDLNPKCVLAVQYEGSDDWYSFEERWYRPETLGELVEDLNLYEDIIFNRVSYSYDNAFGEYVSVRFDDVDQEKIHEFLFSSLDAVDTFDQQQIHLKPREILGVSVSIPILGVENIALEVCEDGYIWTNIVSTGALFYIGEENTEGFVNYVLEECSGYETIYVYEGDGVVKSVLRKFEGMSLSEFWERIFSRGEQGTTGTGEGAATQSSQGYNPQGKDSSGDGAASPSVGPAN